MIVTPAMQNTSQCGDDDMEFTGRAMYNVTSCDSSSNQTIR